MQINNYFLSKIIFGATKKFDFKFFSKLKIFSAFLVKLLNMLLSNQKKIKCASKEKISKLNYIHLKVFISQTFVYFHVIHVHILFQANDAILCTLNTNPKKIQIEKNVKYKNSIATGIIDIGFEELQLFLY